MGIENNTQYSANFSFYGFPADTFQHFQSLFGGIVIFPAPCHNIGKICAAPCDVLLEVVFHAPESVNVPVDPKMSINLFFRFGTSVLHFPEKIEHRAEDHKIHGNGEIGAELVIRHSLTAVHDNVVKAQVDIRVGHGVKISAFKPFSEHFVKSSVKWNFFVALAFIFSAKR